MGVKIERDCMITNFYVKIFLLPWDVPLRGKSPECGAFRIHLEERLYYYSVRVHKHGAVFKQRFLTHYQALGRHGTGVITQIFFHFSQQFRPPLLGRLYSTKKKTRIRVLEIPLNHCLYNMINHINLISRLFHPYLVYMN